MGFGRIGKEVAKSCLGFDMEVYVYDPFLDSDSIKKNKCIPIEKNEGLALADFITIHLPLNENTTNFISEVDLKLMKKNIPQSCKVVVIGGGVVGDNAALIAVGMGADVTIIERSVQRLRYLDAKYQGKARCIISNDETIEDYVTQADLVIGAVLIPGAKAPKLITRELVGKMHLGSVLVDVAIDQGGCFETSKPTTHEKPTYLIDDVIHYCVANMPGGVARTSTIALNNATLPYVIKLANNPNESLVINQNLQNGLNVHKGTVTHKAVADALNYEYIPPLEALKI